MKWFFITILMLNLFYLGWKSLLFDNHPVEIAMTVDGIQSIQLLVELSDAEDLNNKSAVVKIKPKSVACYVYGPIYAEVGQKKAAEKLKAVRAETSLHDTTIEIPSSYWIYMPNVGSDQNLVEMTGILNEIGFKNFNIVKEGKHENAISFGIYRNKVVAIDMLTKLRAQGFKPKMEVEYQAILEYWVHYEIAGKGVLNSDFWTEMEDDFPKAINKNKKCLR